MTQDTGMVGRMVASMIRRSVRSRFHSVQWAGSSHVVPGRVHIFACSHHAWHDGYLMHQAVSRLQVPSIDWIAEFDTFPLFAKVGGMPFPPDDPSRRIATIRSTIRRMKGEGWSLILFADGQLRRPHEPWQFGSALDAISRKVPDARVIPVGIRCEMSVHERPTAYLAFGEELLRGPDLIVRAKAAVERLLLPDQSWEAMMPGTKDVNERMDMRRIPGRGR